jgi:hypothetical protein
MSENILDHFQLPQNVAEAGAREDVARMNLQFSDSGDGVKVMSGFQKDGIPYRFFYLTVFNLHKSQKAGYEVYDEVEAVEFFIDKKTKHVTEVKFLDDERLTRNFRGEIVGGTFYENYRRWKAGMDAPGLPLNKWEAVSPSQVKTLQSENIYSVEQLAATDRDRIVQIFGAGSPFMEIYERAILFQGNKDIIAKSQEQLDQIAAMAEENRKVREELEALRAQLNVNAPIAEVKEAPAGNKLKRRGEETEDHES